MDICVKRTSELSFAEKDGICRLFLDVFGKPKPIAKFDQQFLSTPLGYSYHGLLTDDRRRIVGAYSSIPVRYCVDNQVVVFGLSVDTMIGAGARGNLKNLRILGEQTYLHLAQEGVPFVFGFPNENIYAVRKRVLKWKDIGTLSYYVLPVRPDRKFRSLLLFRPAFLALAALLNGGVRVQADKTIGEHSFRVSKVDDDSFRRFRYGPEHRRGQVDGTEYLYRIEELSGLNCAFLIDVSPLSRYAMERAVADIYRTHAREVDAILYAGSLPFRPRNLFLVPTRFEPKPLYMAGRALRQDQFTDQLFTLANWRVSLADMDVI